MRLWVNRALFLVPSLVERQDQQAGGEGGPACSVSCSLWTSCLVSDLLLRMSSSELCATWSHVCAGSLEQCPLPLPLFPSGTKTLHVPLWPWAGCSRQNLHFQKQRFSGSRDSPDSWNNYLCKTETPNIATRRLYPRIKSTGSSGSCHREPLITWNSGHEILRILWYNDRNHRLY